MQAKQKDKSSLTHPNPAGPHDALLQIKEGFGTWRPSPAFSASPRIQVDAPFASDAEASELQLARARHGAGPARCAVVFAHGYLGSRGPAGGKRSKTKHGGRVFFFLFFFFCFPFFCLFVFLFVLLFPGAEMHLLGRACLMKNL